MPRGAAGRLLVAAAALALGAGCFGEVTEAVAPLPAAPEPVLEGFSVDPLVTRPGESFRLEARIRHAESDSMELEIEDRLGVQQHGHAVSWVMLRDDGTNGDLIAHDGMFTAEGLELPIPENGAASASTTVGSLRRPGASRPYTVRLKLALRAVDPAQVPTPIITRLGADMIATPRVVAIATPLAAIYSVEEVLDTVMHRYYANRPDDRDFVIIVRPPRAAGGPDGQAYRVRGEALGIGHAFVRGTTFGSKARLKHIADLATDFYQSAGIGPQQRLCMATHELTHYWAAYVAPPLAEANHWSGLLRDRSGFGFDGTCRFNPLELYLAGMLPPDSVLGPLSAGGMTIRDFIASNGLRLPGVGFADVDFTVDFIVLHDRLLTTTELTYFDYTAAAYVAQGPSPLGVNWYESTGHRSRLIVPPRR